MDFINDALSQNPENDLNELDVSHNKIGHEGIQYLASFLQSDFCKLSNINIANCQVHGKGGIELLASMKRAFTLEVINAVNSDFSHKIIR